MTGRLDDAVDILGDLVGFPTVASHSNLDLIDYLVGRFERLGADIRLTHHEAGQRANMVATIGPPVDGGVVVSGHSDVVPADEPDWTGHPFIATRRDEKIYGRGTADMKGFIACVAAMAPDFAAAPLDKPLHVAVTYDEEVGCQGAPLLIADLLEYVKPSAAVVGEPTGMSVVTAHKGMHEFTTTIKGLEGHPSVPGQALNAIHYGARYVSGLMEIASALEERAPGASPFDPPHTTISVGTIQGGMARNVVAAECVVEWEMRPVNQSDADYVAEQVEVLESVLRTEMEGPATDADIRTVVEGSVAGLEDVRGSPAAGLCADLVDVSRRGAASFGTEAGLYQAAGVPAVVCGPGDIGVAHRPDEYISLEQLAGCLRFFEGLMGRLSGG